MRGGSRSGMSCAFVRFQTQQMAQLAIEATHGQITLPESTEPLVVRWADAPGTRRRNNNRRSHSSGGSACACSDSCAGRSGRSGLANIHEQPLYFSHHAGSGFGYGAMHMPMQVQVPMQAIGGEYGSMSYYPQSVGGYASGHIGYLPQQHAMVAYPAQQQAMGSTYGPQTTPLAPSQVMLGIHGRGMNQMVAMGQYGYSSGMPSRDQGEMLRGGVQAATSPASTPAVPVLGVPSSPRRGFPRGYPPS